MKNKILPLLFLLVLTNCKNDEKPNQNFNQNIDNENFVKKYFAYFNAHDFKNMAEMYHDSANFKDPSLGPGIVKQSHDQILKKYVELNTVFPDLKDSVIATYTAGNEHIVVEFISSGTGPNKVKFTLPICVIFKIVDNKIVDDYTYFDNFEEK